MSSPIITAENISKQFIIAHENQERYTSLRDVMVQRAKKLVSFSKKPQTQKSKETFYALKDVSFEIKQGDCVGVVGRNGAGKSTLLKVLSRITEPTEGRIKIKGRVASLLEVGTGFHPELTGRENIFLNGAILGMNRSEIRRKFDEIVSFAEVEKFLDTPVKRYSSGMYVRLAFAVAAHLEPEILIVDEVLAVGDAQFQKKCLGKIEDVSKKEARTVLFVSHNMGVIGQLCNTCMFLKNGKLITQGSTSSVIDLYLAQAEDLLGKIERKEELEGNYFQFISMTDEDQEERTDYKFDEDISVKVRIVLKDYNSDLELAMRLMDRYKRAVFTIHERLDKYQKKDGVISLVVTVPHSFITPGKYSWVMCINHPGAELYDVHDDILPFNVTDTGSEFARYDGLDYGSVFAKYTIKNVS